VSATLDTQTTKVHIHHSSNRITEVKSLPLSVSCIHHEGSGTDHTDPVNEQTTVE